MMTRGRLWLSVIAVAPDAAIIPLIGLFGRNYFCQVHALQAGELARHVDCVLFRSIAGHDAPGLCAFFTDDAGQPARIDVGYGHHPAFGEEFIQRMCRPPVVVQDWQIPDDEAAGIHLTGFQVLRVGTGITDVGIRQGNQLAAVRRVGQDFLVARHGGVEHHLPAGVTVDADRPAPEDGAVLERKHSRFIQLTPPDSAGLRQRRMCKTGGVRSGLVPLRLIVSWSS